MERKLVSDMADKLVGSEIIKLAGEIKNKIAQGEPITNLTIGDFNPDFFPIPDLLKQEIIAAYQNNITNYPTSNGMLELRKAVAQFIEERGDLTYTPEEILISAGARPLIYAAYQAIVNSNEKVLFPVPSWNNNHYCHLSNAQQVMVKTLPENNFMPTAKEIKPYINDVAMIALCSPLNPTGTVFSDEQLRGICELVIEENNKRKANNEKPVYLMFDQIYWLLTHGETKHVSPVNIYPELKEYTIYIDGLSKSFASTGVRVGWGMGPAFVMAKMKAILSHIGAWSPKAEQIAVSKYLNQTEDVSEYLTDIKSKIELRLNKLYEGLMVLKSKGYAVDAIAPQAAIYLTVKIDLFGLKSPDGTVFERTEQVTDFILNKAKLGIVPFYAFGTERKSPWYRMSVGTLDLDKIDEMFELLEQGFASLK